MRRFVAVWTCSALLALAPVAAAPADSSATPAPQGGSFENRCFELLELFETARTAEAVDSLEVADPEHAISLIEAEELAIVAEEILAEGDAETAQILLEEALLLLSEVGD